MNPVVFVHLLASLVVIAAAIPLIRQKVGMNHWYGVRIPTAFTSEKAWFAINRFGGRLLLYWGASIAVMAVLGAFLRREYWVIYNWTALCLVMIGLACVMTLTVRYAAKLQRDGFRH